MTDLSLILHRAEEAHRLAVRLKSQFGRRYGHNKANWPLDARRRYRSARKQADALRETANRVGYLDTLSKGLNYEA